MQFIRINKIKFQETTYGCHSTQIQQGYGIDGLKSSSYFYHSIASMRQVFPEHFSVIAKFSLT